MDCPTKVSLTREFGCRTVPTAVSKGKACPLSAVEQQKMEQWTAAHGTPQQVALRCRIVLAAAAGESDVTIAQRLSVNRNTVILWRKRFADEGLDGLWDIAPGRGRKPLYPIDKIAAIVDATLQTKPAGMTHWSCRTMAQSQGVSKSTVNNIWRAHNLQPHRTKTARRTLEQIQPGCTSPKSRKRKQ